MAEDLQTEPEGWITPKQAVQIVNASLGGGGERALMERMRGGIIKAAFTFRSTTTSDAPEPVVEKSPAMIPASYWANLQDQSTLWIDGTARFSFGLPVYGTKTVRLFGIKFLAAEIESEFPQLAPPAPEAPKEYPGGETWATHGDAALPPLTPAAKHAGGAPSKGIWERVWIEIAARLIRGEFDPKKQKDIEDAIAEISESLGDGASEATSRKHAKPLWDKIKHKGS